MFSEKVVFSDSIASGASTSGGVNLKRSWAYSCVSVPTMSTAANIALQASPDGGNTWFPVMNAPQNTSTVAANAFVIVSGVGSSSGMIQIPGCLPYIRFVATAVVSGGVAFSVVCQSD